MPKPDSQDDDAAVDEDENIPGLATDDEEEADDNGELEEDQAGAKDGGGSREREVDEVLLLCVCVYFCDDVFVCACMHHPCTTQGVVKEDEPGPNELEVTHQTLLLRTLMDLVQEIGMI